jgi:DNA-3-methyladenine glycosylase
VILRRSFYNRPTLDVARDLIGKVLVHESRSGIASGVIVEAEAYIGESDPACHAAPGPTTRNAPLYGPPGIAYVYLNYGIHYLVNAVTEAEGWPAAVLIRALEPKDGVALMRRRRALRPFESLRVVPSPVEGRSSSGQALRRSSGPARGRTKPPGEIAVNDLCRGPGNLTKALGIDLRQNLLDLTGSALRIEDHKLPKRPVVWSRRVGINVGVEQEWRVSAADSSAVSGSRRRV